MAARAGGHVFIVGRSYLINKLHRAYSILPQKAPSSDATSLFSLPRRLLSLTTYQSYCAAVHHLSTASSSHPASPNADAHSKVMVEIKGQHVPALPEEHRSLMKQKVISPPDARSLHVAIIGAPNAGKSTLANKLLGWKFATVSKKVHTTREKTTGVLTEDDTQIVFVDTPGMIPPGKLKRFELEKTLLRDPHLALPEADLILVVVDCSHIWHHTRLDEEVLKVLHLHPNTPSVLVLNKVDCLKSKHHLLNITRNLTDGVVAGEKIYRSVHEDEMRSEEELYDRAASVHARTQTSTDGKTPRGEAYGQTMQQDAYGLTSAQAPGERHEDWFVYYQRLKRVSRLVKEKKGWRGFSKVFMVSALSGDGVNDIKEHLLDCSQPGEWRYPAEMITQQEPRQLACLCIREKLLNHLPSEIPYTVNIQVKLWQEDEGLLRTEFDLICKSKRHYSHLLGKHGTTIQSISREAKQDLMNIFRCEMTLRLRVVARGKWNFHQSKKHVNEVNNETQDLTDDS